MHAKDGAAESAFDNGHGYDRGIEGDVGIEAVLRGAFDAIRSHPLQTIGGTVALFVFSFVVESATSIAASVAKILLNSESVSGEAGPTGLMFGAQVALEIAAVVVAVGIQSFGWAAFWILWLRSVRGQTDKPAYAKLLPRLWAPLTLAFVLQAVAVGLGSLALCVGGIVVSLGLMMMPLLVIDHGLNPIASMQASWRVMRGHKVELCLLSILLGFLNFAGLSACGVGLLVTLPLTFGCVTVFYDRIARPGNAYLRL